MNVSQASIKEVIENQEFADIMASIGLIIGQKVDPKELRYTKIVFLADSDVDGGHINTLLTNFFFTFWPELFEMNMIQVAKAPLFEVITDKVNAEVPSPFEGILKEITTELLFKENPPREEMPVRRKQDDYRLFFGPEIGVTSKGLGLPKGVVTGVQLETVLRRLAKAKGYYQFDKLPIPFRAVATDLVTGKAVVFRDGELANVMRASMSVPGAVAPAEFGGMMLVDGMLTSNLPVEAARAMGADIIIAVNVGTPLLKREALTSILGVTGQMLSILTEQNVQASLASLKPTDILISPELGDFSTGDFDHLTQIAPTGEAAARKLADRLAQLAIPEKEYAELRQRQQELLFYG